MADRGSHLMLQQNEDEKGVTTMGRTVITRCQGPVGTQSDAAVVGSGPVCGSEEVDSVGYNCNSQIKNTTNISGDSAKYHKLVVAASKTEPILLGSRAKSLRVNGSVEQTAWCKIFADTESLGAAVSDDDEEDDKEGTPGSLIPTKAGCQSHLGGSQWRLQRHLNGGDATGGVVGACELPSRLSTAPLMEKRYSSQVAVGTETRAISQDNPELTRQGLRNSLSLGAETKRGLWEGTCRADESSVASGSSMAETLGDVHDTGQKRRRSDKTVATRPALQRRECCASAAWSSSALVSGFARRLTATMSRLRPAATHRYSPLATPPPTETELGGFTDKSSSEESSGPEAATDRWWPAVEDLKGFEELGRATRVAPGSPTRSRGLSAVVEPSAVAERTHSTREPGWRAIHIRVGLLSIYFALQYWLLVSGLWDHKYLVLPPPKPTGEALRDLLPRHEQSRARVDFLTSFVTLVHPHVDGFPHLHISLGQAMQRCLALALVEWLILVWLISLRRANRITGTRLAEMLGLLCTILLGVAASGASFGGLGFKTVLYPDIWGALFTRLRSNVFALPTPMLPRLYSVTSLLGEWRGLAAAVGMPRLLALAALCALDCLGALASACATLRHLRVKQLAAPLALLSFTLMVGSYFLGGLPSPDAMDNHRVDFSKFRGRYFELASSAPPPVYLTQYISMKDDTRIAADVYLPQSLVRPAVYQMPTAALRDFYAATLGLVPEQDHAARSTAPSFQRLPSFVMTTRYNRRMKLYWPFTLLSVWGHPRGSSTINVWCWQFVETLTTNGYAVVVVDTRGTGASFGNRPIDFAPAELQDLSTLHEWVRSQPWSNGQVASGGFSYDGMTGLYMAAQAPVEAVIALFTPISVVHDLLQPGGLVCSSFLEDYTGLTRAFETLGTPISHMLRDMSYDIHVVLGFLLAIGRVAPVKGLEFELPRAIQSHQDNWNMANLVTELHFVDDFVSLPAADGKSITKLVVGDFGINRDVVERLVEKQTAVYLVGGYCDSSSVRGAARLFDALNRADTKRKNNNTTRRAKQAGTRPTHFTSSSSGNHKLIIGPWTHTGRRNCSPYSGGSFPRFESAMYWDILRFLDCKLKGQCWGDTGAAAVDYWVVGEERWESSNEFPPRNLKSVVLSLTKELRLAPTGEVTVASLGVPREDDGVANMTRAALSRWPNPTTVRVDPESGGEDRPNGWRAPSPPQCPATAPLHRPGWGLASLAAQSPLCGPLGLTPLADLGGASTPKPSWGLPAVVEGGKSRTALEDSESRTDWQPTTHQQAPSWTLQYIVDYNANFWRGSSRWLVAKHPFRMGVSSESRVSRASPFTFTSAPVGAGGLRIVGSPVLRFSLNVTAEVAARQEKLHRSLSARKSRLRLNEEQPVAVLEVAVFGYLEDVDLSTGAIHYVTEGRVLLSHRPTVAHDDISNDRDGQLTPVELRDWSHCAVPPMQPHQTRPARARRTSHQAAEYVGPLRQSPRLGSADVVYQEGLRDRHRFTFGGVECVVFTFEPVSWYFRPGHAVRLSLVGGDRANFNWGHTQSKEDADLLELSLRSAIKSGSSVGALQMRTIRVKRPRVWTVPVSTDHPAVLLLPILDNGEGSTAVAANAASNGGP